MKILIEGGPLHKAFHACSTTKTTIFGENKIDVDKAQILSNLAWLSYYINPEFFEEDIHNDGASDELEYIIMQNEEYQTISLYVRNMLVRRYDSRTGKVEFFFEEFLNADKVMEKTLTCVEAANYICSAPLSDLIFPIKSIE